MKMRSWHKVGWIFVALLLVTGCLGRGENGERDLRKNLQEAVATETRHAGEIIESLQEKLEQAYDDELNVYAPAHIIAAESALTKGRTFYSGRQEEKAVTEGLFAEVMLVEAYAVKNNARRVLAHVFELKQHLDELGTRRIFPERHEVVVKGIRGAAEAIEKGDMKKALNDESRLLTLMRVLEIDVVTFVRLDKAEEALALAREIGAEQKAPKSWKAAEGAMARAHLYIEKNPGDEVGTVSRGEAATQAVLQALFVTREVVAINDLAEKELWEEIVLGFEGHLNQIGLALGADDVRAMALRDRAAGLAGVAGQLKRAVEDFEKTETVAAEPSGAEEKAVIVAAGSGEEQKFGEEQKEGGPEANRLEGADTPQKQVEADGAVGEPVVEESSHVETGEALMTEEAADQTGVAGEAIDQEAVDQKSESEALKDMELMEAEAVPQAPKFEP